MHMTVSTVRPQEVPVVVAEELLDSALSASIEVPAVLPDVGVPPRSASHLTPALTLVGLAVVLLLFRGWRQTTLASSYRSLGPAEPLAGIPAREDEQADHPRIPRRPRPTPKAIPLPPHVVATLDRLARERAAEAAAQAGLEDEDRHGDADLRGGIEYWVGRESNS